MSTPFRLRKPAYVAAVSVPKVPGNMVVQTKFGLCVAEVEVEAAAEAEALAEVAASTNEDTATEAL